MYYFKMEMIFSSNANEVSFILRFRHTKNKTFKIWLKGSF